MEYANLEQRMMTAYLTIFPDFVPEGCAEVSVSEQKEFYDLMKRLYQMLFDNPSLLFSRLHKDDAFPGRNRKAYRKPELQKQLPKIRNTVEKLLRNMFLAGKGADIRLPKRHRSILSALGVDNLKRLPAAWVWMSNRSGEILAPFAYCLFCKDHVYSVDVYARLLGERVFRRLEAWLISHGYKSYDMFDIITSSCKFSLTYANPLWGSERPHGGNEFKISHTGISAQYDAYAINPVSLGVCIPFGMKHFLKHFDSMSQKVRDFVVKHTKRCDGCRSCVKMDASVSDSTACVRVNHNRTEHKLCPYYPGYDYHWTSIDDDLVDNIIELLAFMDSVADLI